MVAQAAIKNSEPGRFLMAKRMFYATKEVVHPFASPVPDRQKSYEDNTMPVKLRRDKDTL